MWADVERFAIDELIAADPDQVWAGRPRPFAVQLPALGSIEVHWHDYYELGFVLDGRARHTVNGQVAGTLDAGSVFLLSPADLHAIDVLDGGPLHLVNAVLRPELVEQTLEAVRPGDPRLPWGLPELPRAEPDVRRIRDEVADRGPGWQVAVESALVSALVELARVCEYSDEPSSTGPGDSPHLRRAVRYVEQHFREPLTLAQVAEVAHLSPHWFSEQFRRTTGDTFQAYLKRLRLRFARALLDSTSLSVTDVAHASGFGDLSYFGRAYRERYGRPPSRLRLHTRTGERQANPGAMAP